MPKSLLMSCVAVFFVPTIASEYPWAVVILFAVWATAFMKQLKDEDELDRRRAALPETETPISRTPEDY